ncbi:MAG: SDR family oxidoreductase [bacterium]|nr:SDR family oxidoreductase [bacterium]
MKDSRIRTFDGAVAIVTGGASGIGRALAEGLARRGSRVVLADRQIELAEEVTAEVRSRGGEAEAQEVDVTDPAAVEEVVRGTADAHGRLDYLFNNAGIAVAGRAEDNELEDWARVLDVNLRGVVHGIHAAYPIMKAQGFGHLVSTASMAGLIPTSMLASYNAAKHAVVGLSTSLRIEAASAGVRVSVICPGVIRTAILDDGGRYGKLLMDIPEKLRHRLENWAMEPDRFADKALAAVAANKPIIIVPARWKLLWWLQRVSPSLWLLLACKLHDWAIRELEQPSDGL